jgi:hypothetical protein
MDSLTFTITVGAMIGLAVIGTIVSAILLYRGSRSRAKA